MKSGISHRAPSDLVAGYLPLATAAAARFRQHVASQTELDGLVADGLRALHDANLYVARLHGPNRGPNKPARFTAYAKQRIRGAILDRLKKQCSAPGRFPKVQNAIQMPAHSCEAKPSDRNLESEFGIMLRHLEKALAAHGHQVMNRRKETRGRADQSAKVRLLADPQVSFTGRILDVSADGMKLFLPSAILAGSAIEVECEDCTVRAKVAYCLFQPGPNGPGYWLIGIQILRKAWELVEPLRCPKTTRAR